MPEPKKVAMHKLFSGDEWLAMKDVPGWIEAMELHIEVALERYVQKAGMTLISPIKITRRYDEICREVLMVGNATAV